jgi:hypothetical protein
MNNINKTIGIDTPIVSTILPVSNEKNKYTKFKITDQLKKTLVPLKILNELQSVLNFEILNNGLNTENILFIVVKLMETIGKYKKMSGTDKKQVIIILINDAIEDQIENEHVEDFLQMMATNIIPYTIDLLVDVSKNKYKFKNINLKMLSKCC